MIKTYLNIKKKIKTYIKYIEITFNQNDIFINNQLFEFIESETDETNLKNHLETGLNIEEIKELLSFYKKLKESDDLINDCLILLNHLLYIDKFTNFNIHEIILKRYKSNILNYKVACLVTIIFYEYFDIENLKLMNQSMECMLYKNMNEFIKDKNENNKLIKNETINNKPLLENIKIKIK